MIIVLHLVKLVNCTYIDITKSSSWLEKLKLINFNKSLRLENVWQTFICITKRIAVHSPDALRN